MQDGHHQMSALGDSPVEDVLNQARLSVARESPVLTLYFKSHAKG